MFNKKTTLIIILGLVLVLSSGIFLIKRINKNEISQNQDNQYHKFDISFSKNSKIKRQNALKELKDEELQSLENKNHVNKPENVKGIYMSSWVVGTTSIRNDLTQFVYDTQLNSIIIDFKDSTGVVSVLAPNGSNLERINSGSRRGGDLKSYIQELHNNDVYVIARIAVFQDSIYSKNHINGSVQDEYGNLWYDKHKLSWVDPSNTQFHKYILDLSYEAYELGFDEINLDYIRFPTDGLIDPVYPLSTGNTKKDVITNFVKYMYENLNSKNIPLSIDVFGQIVSDNNDMGIGQYYEDLLPYVDAILPMVYPSHFYPGYKNLKSPESSPYDTINLSITDALNRRNAINVDTEIRPWIQDFSIEVNYDATMVQSQINALKNLGINSFMIWDPKNQYTRQVFRQN